MNLAAHGMVLYSSFVDQALPCHSAVNMSWRSTPLVSSTTRRTSRMEKEESGGEGRKETSYGH
jgi:hypothetical protein